MELTSAVRSVSCNNANSLGSKCLTNGNSNGGHGTINRSNNLQPTKDDGSGHEGDDEDEYGGGHGMTKTASTSLASSSAGSINKTFHGHPMQHQPHPHQPVDGVYPRQYHMLNGYMPGGCNSWQPPTYRHPPPPPQQSSICHCCGEVQMVQQFYNPNPVTPFQPQRPPMFSASFVNGGFHFKNCPRAVNFNMLEKRLSYNETDMDHFRFSGPSSMSHYLLGNPAGLPSAYPIVPRAMSMQPQFPQNSGSYVRRPSQQGWTPVGILRNGPDRQSFAQNSNFRQEQVFKNFFFRARIFLFRFDQMIFGNGPNFYDLIPA